MTELRQRWEREKAELRAEGRAQAITELGTRWEREKAELRAESTAEGTAKAILTVLVARGLQVSEAIQQRVLGCKDPNTLDRWLARAATATSDADVIAA